MFPKLVGNGLYGFPAGGYWMDIGTPERYFEATWDLLSGTPESDLPPRDETGSLIGPGCLTAGAHIGPQAVLGAQCSVGNGSSVERSVLHDRVVVERRLRPARMRRWPRACGCERGAQVEPGALVGAGAVVEAGAVVPADARIEPGRHRVRVSMLDDIRAQPHQIGDALWRVDAADIPRADLPGGLVVCGMGGSAIGGDLAAAAIGARATGPLRTVRGYTLGSLGRRRDAGPVRQLLGRHRGDAVLLRRRRRAGCAAGGAHHRRRAGRAGARSRACR